MLDGIFNLLDAILCLFKQIGAFFLNALIDFVNLLIAGIGALFQATVNAWPINFPDIGNTPAVLITAMGWIRWSPFPIAAVLAFFAFWLLVTVAWMVIGPVLRWTKFGAE